MVDPDKKMLRELKREIKKIGNRKRRRNFNKGLLNNPEEAHLQEEDLGYNRSDAMNGLDTDSTRIKERPNPEDSWVFSLTCFYQDEMIYESVLPELKPNQVRKAFSLREDEYPGDCLPVEEIHLEWLKDKIREVVVTSTLDAVNIDLDKFDYFIEVRQGI